MNCECIYFSKKADREKLMRLAEKFKKWGEACEIYPCALSVITADTKCFDDINAFYLPQFPWKSVTIPKDSEVLFVAGKLHYMTSKKVDGVVFRPLFPDRGITEFFKDIIEF